MIETLKTNELYAKLLSELIGLIRAIDGNEHMLNEKINLVIFDALKVNSNNSSEIERIIN